MPSVEVIMDQFARLNGVGFSVMAPVVQAMRQVELAQAARVAEVAEVARLANASMMAPVVQAMRQVELAQAARVAEVARLANASMMAPVVQAMRQVELAQAARVAQVAQLALRFYGLAQQVQLAAGTFTGSKSSDLSQRPVFVIRSYNGTVTSAHQVNDATCAADEIANEIEQAAPMLHTIGTWLCKNDQRIAAWLAIVVAILLWFHPRSNDLTPAQIDNLIKQAVHACFSGSAHH